MDRTTSSLTFGEFGAKFNIDKLLLPVAALQLRNKKCCKSCIDLSCFSACQFLLEFRADQVCGSMKPRHLNCFAHFGDPPDGCIDVRESVYMYIYKENIVREHPTGPQHYPDNGLVSGTRGEGSRNQEEEDLSCS
ncbi:hypothetical protein AVEN_73651-1 [Araneus ventricosus]|uniref:Uncharacterized protein n=1 Tax=Araneus ventricosus TaxID=182803 RepID=A0A4Y2HQ90_ARAVE|nr:hypothetical protein AVEN_73651-1 [Araneus ventricosus]